MATYTNAEAVRLKFLIEDHQLLSTAVLEASIADAHEEILGRLDSSLDVTSVPELLELGETLLAGAHLMRSLAAHDAAWHQDLQIGGQHITQGKWFSGLSALADQVEKRAWATLQPYLETAVLPAIALSDSQPILGA